MSGAGYDAIVLAGGQSQRMGGDAKTALEVGGIAILARVTAALRRARRVVLVGDSVPGARADVITHEEPPGGGPVAALAAGLRHVHAPIILTLAGDLPFLTEAAVETLVGQLRDDVQRAVAVDGVGREQLLCAAWTAPALRAALEALGSPIGAAMRGLVTPSIRTAKVNLPGEPPPWWDCDDPVQLALARTAAGGQGDA
ncbi:MAG: molybdenum cofactor guanylyltransferase [Jatrophihabitans sp.]